MNSLSTQYQYFFTVHCTKDMVVSVGKVEVVQQFVYTFPCTNCVQFVYRFLCTLGTPSVQFVYKFQFTVCVQVPVYSLCTGFSVSLCTCSRVQFVYNLSKGSSELWTVCINGTS